MNQWIIQTLDLFPWDPRSSKTILRVHRLQDARTRKMLQTYPGARLTSIGRTWKFSTIVSTKKTMSELQEMAVHFFNPDLGWKLSKLMKTVRNISNTGSKNYVWLIVRKIHGSASEMQMLLVEALWVMPSVTGCHTLSTAIRKEKPNISYGGTSRYTFATSFIGNKPETKTTDCTKKMFKTFLTNYNL